MWTPSCRAPTSKSQFALAKKLGGNWREPNYTPSPPYSRTKAPMSRPLHQIPKYPVGSSPYDTIREAHEAREAEARRLREYSQRIRSVPPFGPEPIPGGIPLIFWLYQKVKNKGPWDFKQDKSEPEYESTGNWNFGLAAAALGLDLEFALTMAGAAQIRAGTAKLEWWKTNFDDPYDQARIMEGYHYYNYAIDLEKNSGNFEKSERIKDD